MIFSAANSPPMPPVLRDHTHIETNEIRHAQWKFSSRHSVQRTKQVRGGGYNPAMIMNGVSREKRTVVCMAPPPSNGHEEEMKRAEDSSKITLAARVKTSTALLLVRLVSKDDKIISGSVVDVPDCGFMVMPPKSPESTPTPKNRRNFKPPDGCDRYSRIQEKLEGIERGTTNKVKKQASKTERTIKTRVKDKGKRVKSGAKRSRGTRGDEGDGDDENSCGEEDEDREDEFTGVSTSLNLADDNIADPEDVTSTSAAAVMLGNNSEPVDLDSGSESSDDGLAENGSEATSDDDEDGEDAEDCDDAEVGVDRDGLSKKEKAKLDRKASKEKLRAKIKMNAKKEEEDEESMSKSRLNAKEVKGNRNAAVVSDRHKKGGGGGEAAARHLIATGHMTSVRRGRNSKTPVPSTRKDKQPPSKRARKR